MKYTFSNVPLELRDTTAWQVPDLSCLTDQELQRFERMRRAITMGLAGGTATEAAAEACCSRAVLGRQLNRCLSIDEQANLAGWFGLMAHRRLGAYHRTAALPTGKCSAAGAAGAFQVFLTLHPKIHKALDRVILAKEPDQPRGTKRRKRSVFQTFLEACKAPGEALTDVDYPLNTEGRGRRAVERYIQSYLNANASSVTPWYGEDAAERSRLGSGLQSFMFATQPLDDVAYDAHHADVIGVLVVPGPAGPQRIPVKRLWFCPLVDRVSHAILGYSVATCVEPSAAMLEEAFVNASTAWTPRTLRIAGLAYMSGAGLPFGVVKGMPACRPARLTLDNAAQHFATRVIQGVRRSVGCAIEFGPIGAWWHNTVAERLFRTLEGYGFHRLPSSMGSGPADPCRRDPVGRAVRDCIEQEELIELTDVLVANYNATPSRGLGNQSPLQVLAAHLASRRAPWLPRMAPPQTAFAPKLGVAVEFPFVRGALRKGRAPYVQIDGPEYSSPELSKRYDLIGRRVCVHVNEWDMRTAKIYEASGQSLGELKARGTWSLTKHSRADRKAINALRTAGELVVDEAADPVVAYMEHLTVKARKEAALKRVPKVSVAASVLARARETTGLPVPDVATAVDQPRAAPATGTLPRGIPQPDWSTVRR